MKGQIIVPLHVLGKQHQGMCILETVTFNFDPKRDDPRGVAEEIVRLLCTLCYSDINKTLDKVSTAQLEQLAPMAHERMIETYEKQYVDRLTRYLGFHQRWWRWHDTCVADDKLDNQHI